MRNTLLEVVEEKGAALTLDMSGVPKTQHVALYSKNGH